MKKVIKIIILILLALPILYGLLFFTQNHLIKRTLEGYNESKLDDEHALVRCNYDILKPEFAYVFFAMNKGHISFDQINKVFWNVEDWQTSYTGGTTIKNTTFPELVKMVKEDCSQFQRAKGDIRDETINWSYSKYVPEVPKTQKEIREEERSLEIFKKKIESGEITSTELEGFVEIKE